MFSARRYGLRSLDSADSRISFFSSSLVFLSRLSASIALRAYSLALTGSLAAT